MLVLAAIAGCMHEIAVPPKLELTSAVSGGERSLPVTFKLVELNVHGRPGELVAQAVVGDPALADADIIVMPESASYGDCSTACAAARELGMHAAYLPRYFADDHTEGLGIVSRVPLENVRVLRLPEIKTLIHGEVNTAIAAQLWIGGQLVTLYAVHLTLRINTDERIRQLRPVLEDAARHRTPALVIGDMNTVSVTWAGHIVPVPTGSQAPALERLVRQYGFATPVTGSGTTGRVIPMRIDGMYTRGFETRHYGTAGALSISDHKALWAVMSVTG